MLRSRARSAGLRSGGASPQQQEGGNPMPLYNVLFHTSTESLWRQYPAANADECLVAAEAQFRMSNDDHGELHEVVVMPPEGRDYLDRSDGMEDDRVLEYYRLTEEGQRAN